MFQMLKDTIPGKLLQINDKAAVRNAIFDVAQVPVD